MKIFIPIFLALLVFGCEQKPETNQTESYAPDRDEAQDNANSTTRKPLEPDYSQKLARLEDLKQQVRNRKSQKPQPILPKPQPKPPKPQPKPLAWVYANRQSLAFREAAVHFGGGDPDKVLSAVEKALKWFKTKQNQDGSWGATAKGAMTGFGLMCFLGNGQTDKSPKYGNTVLRGINFLVDLGNKKNGWLYTTNNRHGAAYAHGIATHALAEAYIMTKKEHILPVLEKAVHRIVSGQKQDGGWYYLEERKGPNNLRFDDFGKNIKDASDTSVSGWQFHALKTAYNTGVPFTDLKPALEAAVKNFYRVYSPKNGGFGYRKASDSANIKHKLTGVGALGLQSWKSGHPSEQHKKEVLKNAIEHILKNNKDMNYGSEDANLYSWYYDTQALFYYGGVDWTSWNRQLEPMLLNAQNSDGSWPAEGSTLTSKRAGKDADVYRTSLCALMLETYYRYATPKGVVDPSNRQSTNNIIANQKKALEINVTKPKPKPEPNKTPEDVVDPSNRQPSENIVANQKKAPEIDVPKPKPKPNPKEMGLVKIKVINIKNKTITFSEVGKGKAQQNSVLEVIREGKTLTRVEVAGVGGPRENLLSTNILTDYGNPKSLKDGDWVELKIVK
jgi:hypothetical protein